MTAGSPAPRQACPPGPEQPLAQFRDQPDTCHTLSAASGLRETLQDISALSQFYPSRKCHQAISALSPGPAEGGPAPPARKAWVPFPLRATHTPRARAGFLHAPRAPFLLHVASGPPQGTSPGPPGWPQVLRGSGRRAARCGPGPSQRPGVRQVSDTSVAEEHAGGRQGVGVESFLLFSRVLRALQSAVASRKIIIVRLIFCASSIRWP